MQLLRLSLLNFRNYKDATIDFSDGIHVLYGENGAGKTSIIEAIHYLALTKSFRTTVDRHLILHQEEMFRIQGEFRTGQGQPLTTALAYAVDRGKQLTVNGQKIARFSEYIGEVPVVLLHPEDLNISQGSPRQRRRFLDMLLCQSSKLYLHDLIQYNRSLKQRNQLLQSGVSDPQLLIPWEENLISYGSEIILKRKKAVEQLNELVNQFYRKLSGREDRVNIVYQCNVQPQAPQEIAQIYARQFERKRAQEVETGSTIVGPHRDDLIFTLNGRPMRLYASQGEHKTCVIALKLAEFHYLQQQQQQSPILLFDDIFGELDAHRIREMLHQLSHIGQVFVTTTSRTFFEKVPRLEVPTHYYHVENATVTLAA
ncbi:MAG: DNA replication/repair protein RecF [Calditrichaeota bacterium]|nr:MAG: DNA replication/repair protein RecF [Calditrichota bacterium]